MTHVLIAADLYTVGIVFVLIIVGVMIVAGLSSGQIIPLRRSFRRGFWQKEELSHPMFGTGLFDDLHDTTNQSFSNSPDDLSIYQAHDSVSHATPSESTGSILGLDGGTPSGSLEHADGYGDLGHSAGDYLNLDSSSGGGSFGDSGYCDSDSSFSDSSFSDNSSGESFSSDN